MAHLLVNQLRFARNEFWRGMEGVTEPDALVRVGPMNCLSWFIGHLASAENHWWNLLAQGIEIEPGLRARVGYGQPASTPPLEEMREAWLNITRAADRYLDTLTPELLVKHIEYKGRPREESIGTMLMRDIYHYWYHTGEAQAVRQQLGHSGLPEFVGGMAQAAYQPE